ncbi:Dabb family protein [Luteolibacter ambystomatis]|uniref:Dabb family protein n=1 Tax=Luteolibacter ambystomatis TaxID=2824561 RepID=A0A975IZC7_9BACT|nr:Dabb family protein [Luteolibacter ambystomatis]QUE51152.1 Dabb family protein [Luteolibacter ambystomatis]
MISHVVFFQLKPEVDEARVEEMVRTTRSLLLKIPEVLSVKSGRNVDTASEWQFFFNIETESLEKLKITLEDPFHLKFVESVIKPSTTAHFAMDFELDPSKDLRYS